MPGAFYLLLSLLAVVYHVVPVALWGQTLGKKIMSIRVVSGQDLSQPGWWRAIRRWGLYFLIGLIPIIGGIVACIVLPLVGLVMLRGPEASGATRQGRRHDRGQRRRPRLSLVADDRSTRTGCCRVSDPNS